MYYAHAYVCSTTIKVKIGHGFEREKGVYWKVWNEETKWRYNYI